MKHTVMIMRAGVLLLGLSLLLTQCSQPGPGLSGISAPAFAPAIGEAVKARQQIQKNRPGLGTGFGDSVGSPIRSSSFTRQSKKPSSMASLYYNDKEGIKAMAHYTRRSDRMQKTRDGIISWGIKSGFSLLKNRNTYSGKRFAIAQKGKTYSIVLKNNSRARAEAVLSVDGLDVMDGKPASVRKRGYIIEPGKTLEVEGFRTSRTEVAQFRFSSVNASYSELKHGTSRNVGVIGVAVFTEKGNDPWVWMPKEVTQRNTASAFAEAP